jgi:2-polyprenyl-3-methyl-5-hydroxy-6-metoxy-1,4-benzoquinol methylase
MDLGDQYRQMHADGHFRGYSCTLHTSEIKKLIKQHKAKTLLDYGCGKGEQYTKGNMHIELGIMPTLYDPYCVDHSKEPEGKFDGVICCDVLEHVPADDLAGVIQRIYALSKKFIFFTICTRPAKKLLPDGRNCHLTIMAEAEWIDIIGRAINEFEAENGERDIDIAVEFVQ